MSDQLRCICCGRDVEPAGGPLQTHNQPYGATSFQSHGQYGSTLYDEGFQSDRYLEVNICDLCLATGARAGLVNEVTPVRPAVTFTEAPWVAPEGWHPPDYPQATRPVQDHP